MAISCNLYDTIEIVCMYRYPVTLLLKSGDEVIGIAVDTALNEQKAECIALDCNGKQILVVLDELKQMRVNVDNPHLTVVEF
ncbi:MAG: Rho-binding antiterminator [Psychrobium sp.]